MLKITFAVINLIIIALLIGSCIMTSRRKNKFRRQVIQVITMGIVTIFWYTIFLLTPMDNQRMAVFTMGMYYLSIDWLSFFLADYSIVYTESETFTKIPCYILIGLSVIDGVGILINNFTGHVFHLEAAYYAGTNLGYWAAYFDMPYLLHLGICYIMIAFCYISLIRKTITAPGFYRKKYAVILALIVAVTVINAVYYTLNLPVDFSVLFYGVLGIAICYFTVYATPKHVIERTHSYVVEDVGNAIFCFDVDGKCVYINKAAKAIFGSWDETECMKKIETVYRVEFEQKLHGEKDSEVWEGTKNIDGREHYFNFEYRNMRDRRGNSIGCFFKLEDKTDDVIRFKEEQYRATHDRLTGLYNRESFFEKAQEIIKACPENQMLLLASNIKDFKLINELYGLEMGDKVLLKQAELIRENLGENAAAGRISGDKFALLMPKNRFDEERFMKSVEQLCSLTENNNYKMHVYIGVYIVVDQDEAVETMYDKAGLAIERVRGDYQQIITYYDDSDLEELIHEKNVVAEFDRAIANREFCIYLQPQVDCDGNALGAEALVRWQHPDKGLLFPGAFLGIIEKAGLIYKLDYYIWEMAAMKLAEWKKEGKGQYHISVNISAKDFYYLDLYETFTGLVKKYDIEPDKLNLEITETVIMSDVKMHMQIINRLQEYGFHIEIDDFGSGYSSLNTLKDINADVIKIDMLFLRETENQARSKTIVNSIISMAKAHNMPVITEGVETQNQVEFLSDMGCDMFQGYYFSKPIPVQDFEGNYLKAM